MNSVASGMANGIGGTDDAQPKSDHAAIFRSVADKIDTNKDNGFAGAFVIAPPQGEPKEMLLLNNTGDLVMFWSLVQTTAKLAIEELELKERQGGLGGRR